MTPVVGVDPGSRDGACVVLDGRDVVDWMVWWTRKSGMVQQRAGHGVEPCPKLSEAVGRWRDLITVAPCGYTLAVEGLFVVASKGNADSIRKLAHSAGLVQGVLEQRSVGETHHPLARDWRRSVLGLRARTSAAQCEKYARETVPHRFRFLHGLPSNARANGAACEAVCIAEWARTAMVPDEMWERYGKVVTS